MEGIRPITFDSDSVSTSFARDDFSRLESVPQSAAPSAAPSPAFPSPSTNFFRGVEGASGPSSAPSLFGVETNYLDILSYSGLLANSEQSVRDLLGRYYKLSDTSPDSISKAISRDQDNVFNVCSNKNTPSGIRVDYLNRFSGIVEYTSSNQSSGYCFDIADIARRFEHNDFVNPFTGKYFSDTFIQTFKTRLQDIYAQNGNSDSSVTDIVNSYKIGRIKLESAFSLIEPKTTKNQLAQRVDNFLSTLSDPATLDQFISRNLKTSAPEGSNKLEFAIDTWVSNVSRFYSEQEKAKMSSPVSFFYSLFKQ